MTTYAEHMRQAAREYFVELLKRHNECVRQAAIEAGMHRGTLHDKLVQLGIRAPHRAGNAAWQALAEPPKRFIKPAQCRP